MRRIRTMIVLCVFMMSACFLFAQVSDNPTPPMSNESTQLWFVELNSPPTVEGTDLSTLQNEKSQFRTAATQSGLRFTVQRSYDKLWNGVSVRVAASQVPLLGSISGVKAIYPVLPVAYEPVKPIDVPEMASAVTMTGVDLAQSILGLDGAHVKVGIIDTGIDYNHPDLGGCFGRGCRVVGGYDFVGDAFNADPASPSYNPTPVPDPDPMDCAGHGTHVAGIVGANGNPATNGVRGVAPAVKFYAYRVFGCAGSTTSDIMIDAMERALDDGVDVVNMSIGASYQWPQYPTAQAADRLVNRGIVVVASIGNDGATGIYSASAPGVGKKVIGVASFDNTHIAMNYFTTADGTKYGYLPATGAPPAPLSGSSTLVRTGTATTTNDGCSPIATDLTGKVALIRRGTCSFYTKATNALAAGATGVVLYNNVAGFLNATVAGTPAISIPVSALNDTEGVALDSAIQAGGGSITITWATPINYFVNPLGGYISSFSAFGLAPDLSFKPDISAPGGNIRSTYPLALGGYAVLSGTSMASPHIAGAAALYLQAYPNTAAPKIREILMNNAIPKNWWGNPGLGFLDNTHRQGAGLLNIYDAVLNRVSASPEKIAVGDSTSTPLATIVTLKNRYNYDVTYDISYVDAVGTGPNTFTPSYVLGTTSVTFSSNSIKVPRRDDAAVMVTIAPDPTLADGSVYGGYILFTPRSGGQTLRIPIAGYKGNYKAVQALAPTKYGFPWLASLQAGNYQKQGDNTVYTLANGDMPYFLLHLDEGVPVLKVEVLDAATNKSWHYIDSEKYVGRNSSSTGFFALSWDGTTTNSRGTTNFTVPNGTYVVKINVLKPLGSRQNPADWESWISPRLIISRP